MRAIIESSDSSSNQTISGNAVLSGSHCDVGVMRVKILDKHYLKQLRLRLSTWR
jgi:hypothetical protein